MARLAITTKYKRALSNLERLEYQRDSLDLQINKLDRQLTRWSKKLGQKSTEALHNEWLEERQKKRLLGKLQSKVITELEAYAKLAGIEYPRQWLYDSRCKRHRGYFLGPRHQQYPSLNGRYHVPLEESVGYIFGVGLVCGLVPFSTGGWMKTYTKLKGEKLK